MNDTKIDEELNSGKTRDIGDLMGGSSLVADAAEAVPASRPRFDDAMVDIETFSVHTSRAFIISIGLIPFRLLEDGPKFGRPILLLPDALEQIAAGRKISEETVQWWMDQSPEAREHWANRDYEYKCSKFDEHNLQIVHPRRVSIEGVANHLKEFWDEQMSPKATLWANGIVFDVGNIENMIDCKVPWVYNAARDSRTINRKCLERVGREVDEKFKQTLHDPIDDCVWQTWDLWARDPGV